MPDTPRAAALRRLRAAQAEALAAEPLDVAAWTRAVAEYERELARIDAAEDERNA